MSELTIRTNNHFRPFLSRHEVPEKVLKDRFDYQNPEDVVDGFFCYKGEWFHLDQFMRLGSKEGPFAGWDGYHGDSYFSGTLIKLSEDGETYKVARYYS